MLFTRLFLPSFCAFKYCFLFWPSFHANIMKRKLVRLNNQSRSPEPHYREGLIMSNSDSGFTVIKTRRRRRRRRMEMGRLKYTCQTLMNMITIKEDDEVDENGVVVASLEEEKCEMMDPETEHVTCVSHGSVSVIGRRREMEDTVKAEVGFVDRGGQRYDFYGVYDGHGGTRVAEACRERLHRILAEEVGGEEIGKGIDWERAMEGCFEKMDEEVNRSRMDEEMVGSTAVVAVVGRDIVVVANCGDSRAVLCRSGVAIALSSDHKPDREDELERVEAAGGRVINWNGHRVLGVLATSRSIGDQYLKPYVISKPEVTVSKLTHADEFLILASDGLWDVISNDVACRVVRRFLNRRMAQSTVAPSQNRTTKAAVLLADLAMARGSRDNVSVIVVELNSGLPA